MLSFTKGLLVSLASPLKTIHQLDGCCLLVWVQEHSVVFLNLTGSIGKNFKSSSPVLLMYCLYKIMTEGLFYHCI